MTTKEKINQLKNHFNKFAEEGIHFYGYDEEEISICFTLSDEKYTVVDYYGDIIEDKVFDTFEDALEFYLELLED